jgi:hypothetical protein
MNGTVLTWTAVCCVLVGEAALLVTLLLLLAPTGDFNDFAGTSKIEGKTNKSVEHSSMYIYIYIFFFCCFMQ